MHFHWLCCQSVVLSHSDGVRAVWDFHQPCPEGSSMKGLRLRREALLLLLGVGRENHKHKTTRSAIFCIANEAVSKLPRMGSLYFRQDISKSNRPWKTSEKREERGHIICNSWLFCTYFWGITCMCDCRYKTTCKQSSFAAQLYHIVKSSVCC